MEAYYSGAKVYAITTHLKASKMPPTREILCLSLCLYGIRELASATSEEEEDELENLPGEVSRTVYRPDELSLSLHVIQSDPPVSVAVHLILILDSTQEILQEVELIHAR